MMRYGSLVTCVTCWLTVALTGVLPARAGEDPNVVAQEVDRLLAEESPVSGSAAAPLADDTTFLRRVFLDLVGQPPAPDDVLAFLLDEDPGKRREVVRALLADPAYGENWARYWRDVILYRRSEDRAFIVSPTLASYLTDRFNENTPWSETATSFITALGDVTEHGETALIMAQNGQPEETVAEISRIFLGIQIQCAQCHDHPTDRWKREQFHQLAAFFPRVAVRPNRDGDRRSFLVTAADAPLAVRRPNANMRLRGTPEHRMPDLNDPQAEGTVMTPVFFATGATLSLGTRDAERRAKLAEWLTSVENPWFAKAFVNRMWSELCGEGFYEPVDDLGPDRQPTAPRTLEYLATEFTRAGYDVKWLFTAVTATQMYQRASGPRRLADGVPFQSNVIQPLRADQLFNCLQLALGLQEPGPRAGSPAPNGPLARGPRTLFNVVFGYDPSLRRDEVTVTIPQAQALMNGGFLDQAIDAQRGPLAQILAGYPQLDDAVSQLYLRTVSRLPTADELRECQQYVESVKIREEAFEDLLWSLVNSTEFVSRP